MPIEGFDLFYYGEENDGKGYTESVGLDELLSRIPAKIEPQDVTLFYKGCGTHEVRVQWSDPNEEES